MRLRTLSIKTVLAAALIAACNRPPIPAEEDSADAGEPDPSWAHGELFLGQLGDLVSEGESLRWIRIDPAGTWVYGRRNCTDDGYWEAEQVGTWDTPDHDLIVLHTPEGGQTPHNWAQDWPETYLRRSETCPRAELFFVDADGVETEPIALSRGTACLQSCGDVEMTIVGCDDYTDPCAP